MKNKLKKIGIILTIMCIMICVTGKNLAHSGRTDSNEGHRDNKNKSGLGSYHYHCAGTQAHLHSNGICPYSSNTSSISTEESDLEPTNPVSAVVEKEQEIILATEIKINEEIINMKVNEEKQLTATIIPDETTNKNVIWQSDNETIATVDSTGRVTGIKEGKVNITVYTSNEKKASIKINIEDEQKQKDELKKVQTIASINNNEIKDEKDKTNDASGILGLGLIGGGAYWGYKKYKQSKNK